MLPKRAKYANLLEELQKLRKCYQKGRDCVPQVRVYVETRVEGRLSLGKS